MNFSGCPGSWLHVAVCPGMLEDSLLCLERSIAGKGNSKLRTGSKKAAALNRTRHFHSWVVVLDKLWVAVTACLAWSSNAGLWPDPVHSGSLRPRDSARAEYFLCPRWDLQLEL